MKKFTINLKNNHKIDIDAEDEADVIKKINSGHYNVLPVRARRATNITQDDIIEIIEINNFNKEK